MLDDILMKNFSYSSYPWLIIDPLRIVEVSKINELKFGLGDSKELAKYFITLMIRDIIGEALINVIKNNFRHLVVKELSLSFFAGNLLKKRNIFKILKSPEVYTLLDKDDRLVNIIERQQFDLFKNGYNLRMVEMIVSDEFKKLAPYVKHYYV